MHIKNIQLSNFNGISDFEADFNGAIYFLTGDNEVGKSTILSAIGMMLGIERTKVLKNGEKKGFGKMIIGDDEKEYQVDLKFTEANPMGTLTITSDDGMKSSNVSMLQKIFGYTDFDAVEFSRWSETAEGRRKQISVVKSLLSEDVQKRIDEIDSEVKTTKELRKEANSSVKTYSTIVENASSGLVDGDLVKYGKKIEIDELMQKQNDNAKLIEKAKTVRLTLAQRIQQLDVIPDHIENAKTNAEIHRKKLNAESEEAIKERDRIIKKANEDYATTQLRIDEDQKENAQDCANEILRLQNEKLDFETKKSNAEKWLAEYEANDPEKTNVADQLKKAQEHNDKHIKVLDLKEKSDQLKKAEETAKKHDDSINALLEERESIIATSSLPIEGLTFTEDGLELKGVPFISGKVSDSQIMEIAMKLTVAVNPTVKVVRIARGESLGAKRLKQIIDHAKENGFQGFIENVKRGQTELQVEEYTEE